MRAAIHFVGVACYTVIILYPYYRNTNIHVLHAGEGNMKIYSPKSIIFPKGIARGEYDTRG